MELVEVYEAPEAHAAIAERLLHEAGIPYERAPGVAGYPMVEPFVRLRVPADRAEEAKNLIRVGPAMPPPPPPQERQFGFTAEMEKPLAIASRAPREAMALVETYVAGNPQDVNGWTCAATVASIASGAATAEDLLRRGLEANPDHPWLRALLGHCLETQGRLEEARAVYERLISTNPDAPHGYAGLATLACSRNLPDDARAHAEDATERLHPIYQPRAALDLALVWLETGDTSRAREILQTLVDWGRRGGTALFVATLLEADTDVPDDVVDEAFDDARRFWNHDRDGDWDEELANARDLLEKRAFFRKFE